MHIYQLVHPNGTLRNLRVEQWPPPAELVSVSADAGLVNLINVWPVEEWEASFGAQVYQGFSVEHWRLVKFSKLTDDDIASSPIDIARGARYEVIT